MNVNITIQNLRTIARDEKTFESLIDGNKDLEYKRRDYSRDVYCAGFVYVDKQTITGFIKRCKDQ